MRPRRLLIAIAAALLLAACQPSASPTGSPSPAPAEESVAGFPDLSGSPFPSFVGNPDLEATLPTSAADITFFVVSMSGPDFMTGEVDPQFVDFLDRLGADIEDVSVAVAIGSNADGTQTASVFAFQVAGEDAESLIDEFKASGEASGDGLVWHDDRLGGKAVQVAEPTDEFPTPIALYATGDVLYFASSSSEQALTEIVEQLP